MAKKKKILLLSDDLRMHSGIATQSKEFVMGTIHKYDWVQLGGAIKHPDAGKLIDISQDMKVETGVSDASLKIYPVSGYGNQDQGIFVRAWALVEVRVWWILGCWNTAFARIWIKMHGGQCVYCGRLKSL